ncbi:MAG: methyltransferase [Gammaproteobacteria bacterium RIFCSPHIGHO2_12_FULL_63_22]|nr:MAG: methyltransferase [Gammaproteobacteria bacterium RIFCSPHIGHO2_12_FULL_63_22]
MYTEIKKCRVCGSGDLNTVLSLGEQHLTGVFPRSVEDVVTKGPLDIAFCGGCGLLQMRHSYDPGEMYGDNYGYRSGLNASMVRHLQQKIRSIERLVNPEPGSLVIDIGSNDATLLKAYEGQYQRVGIDPTGQKFREFYDDDISLITDFFSAAAIRASFPGRKARIITSIAMFYDLAAPLDFVADLESILADDGIWHFEQSYMPSMLRTNSYDTICHEHLEFYSLRVVKDILGRCGMRIIDVQMNAVNGGSFAVTACKDAASYKSNSAVIDWLLRQEDEMELTSLKPYEEFASRVFRHRKNLKALVEALVADGKTIVGYGASTKGNVLLQFCGLGPELIKCIAEVNQDKFGAFTPGTHIPIVSERDARAMQPDYFLVFPWHFKHGILEREREFSERGGKFIFPLPEIEII